MVNYHFLSKIFEFLVLRIIQCQFAKLDFRLSAFRGFIHKTAWRGHAACRICHIGI
jgi:hypothetical protein